MFLRPQDLFRTLLRAPVVRTTPPPRPRARLSLDPLEDRTVPSVTVEAIRDPAEGGASGTFRFVRSGSTSSPLTQSFSVSGTAASGTDYTGLGTSVTFAPGQAELFKSVFPVNDTAIDPDETITVAVGTSAATLIMVDNEGVIRPALYLDYSKYKGLPGHDLFVSWTVFDPATGKTTSTEVTVAIPGSADAQTVRDLVTSTLEDNGFVVSDKENNRQIVKAGGNLRLRALGFRAPSLVDPNTITGKIKLLAAPSDGTTPKLYVNGQEVSVL